MLCTAPGIYLTGVVRGWRKDKHAHRKAGVSDVGLGLSTLEDQCVNSIQLTWEVGFLLTAEWEGRQGRLLLVAVSVGKQTSGCNTPRRKLK